MKKTTAILIVILVLIMDIKQNINNNYVISKNNVVKKYDLCFFYGEQEVLG